MSTLIKELSLTGSGNLIKQLSIYYDQQQAQKAIQSLKKFYTKEAFDNEDIKNDWIKDDFINCHGIEIFADELSNFDNKQLSKKVNSLQNKQTLFQWFCYWLLDDVIEPKNHPFNTHIGKIAIQLEPKLRSNLQITIAESTELVEYFEKICREEHYTEVHDLRSDFADEDSYILDEIIKQFPKYRSYKSDIFRLIDSIINDRYMYDPFDLRSVNFKYRDSKESFDAAKELCMTEMERVFKGAAKEYDSKIEQINQDNVDTQLIHAKALDFENRFPFLMCMIDCFSRHCCEQNRKHWTHFGYNLKPTNIKDVDISVTQTAANWLMSIDFGKFFRSKHAETAQRYGVAMQSMMKRVLPRIELNHVMCDTIFDSLDIFCRYALAMNKFVYKLNCERMVETQFLPCQIDFWIIPRLTKSGQHHDMQLAKDLFDVSMESLGITTDFAVSKKQKIPIYKNDVNINCLAKSNKGSDKASIWNLEYNLGEAGYVKNKDYFVLSEKQYGQKLDKQFWKLWCQNLSWDLQRYKRYVFIVDRRNPTHIGSKTMVDDTSKYQTWSDKLYLIKPKKCNEISKHFEYKLTECFAANFKDYLFPVPQLKSKDMNNDFGGLDSGNGYKFVLSYHIQFKHRIKAYWSYEQGLQRFFIDDIEWLWPRYFNLINNRTQFQLLSQETKNELKLAKNKYVLRDEQFDDFCKQISCF